MCLVEVCKALCAGKENYPEQLRCAVFSIPVPFHTSTGRHTIAASKKAKELGARMIKKKSYREKKDLKKAPESGVRIIQPRLMLNFNFFFDVWK